MKGDKTAALGQGSCSIECDWYVQGFDGELDLDAALDKKRGPNKNDRFENRVSKKREAKDSKFGETLLHDFSPYQVQTNLQLVSCAQSPWHKQLA